MLKIMLTAAALAASISLCQADPVAPDVSPGSVSPAPAPAATPAKTPPIHEIQQPSVIPITLSASDLNMLITYLQNQPYQQAAPLMQFLSQKENEAQIAAHGGKK